VTAQYFTDLTVLFVVHFQGVAARAAGGVDQYKFEPPISVRGRECVARIGVREIHSEIEAGPMVYCGQDQEGKLAGYLEMPASEVSSWAWQVGVRKGNGGPSLTVKVTGCRTAEKLANLQLQGGLLCRCWWRHDVESAVRCSRWAY